MHPSFKVGKNGKKMFTSTTEPSSGVSDSGDFWLDPITNEVKGWNGASWQLIVFDNIKIANNTIEVLNTDGNLNVRPNGTGDFVIGVATGGTSTMTAPDDQSIVIQAGAGTGANDGGDLTFRGGAPQGAGAYGRVILGQYQNGIATLIAADSADAIIQAGASTNGNDSGNDLYLRGGDGTGGNGIDGRVIIDIGNVSITNTVTAGAFVGDGSGLTGVTSVLVFDSAGVQLN